MVGPDFGRGAAALSLALSIGCGGEEPPIVWRPAPPTWAPLAVWPQPTPPPPPQPSIALSAYAVPWELVPVPPDPVATPSEADRRKQDEVAKRCAERRAEIEAEKKKPVENCVKGPVGMGEFGGGAVSGGEIRNASSVIASRAAGFRRCFNEASKDGVEPCGTLRMTVRVNEIGAIVSVHTESIGLDRALSECVASKIWEAQFDAPEGGAATLIIPVAFIAPPSCH
jgi:hypothetical protein